MAEKVPKYSDPNSSGQIQSMLVNENLIAIWPEGVGDALESSESLKLALDTLQVHISNDAQGSQQKLQQNQKKRETKNISMQRIQKRLLLSEQVRAAITQQLQDLEENLQAQQP